MIKDWINMRRLVSVLFVLGFFSLIISQVSGVLFADDYIYLFEDGQSVPDNVVIIDPFDMYPKIYTGGVFIRSQIESTNLSIYKTNETDLLEYIDWLAMQTDESVNYEMYIEQYINQQINNSIYSININLPEPEDNQTYGSTIGVYRYFNVDIKTGSIELFDTKKPKTTGFELFVAFCVIIFIMVLILKKLDKSP